MTIRDRQQINSQMKVEYLKYSDTPEVIETDKFERVKLVTAWIVLSVLVTAFIFSRRPMRVRVASSKTR
jgi:hypothetical protein